jgi:acyl-CoA thioester hydrolase
MENPPKKNMIDYPQPDTQLSVLPEWLDENGHMTSNAYLPAFDQATEAFLRHLKLGWTYADGKFSLFTLGMNLDFRGELLVGNRLSIKTSLLDHDQKRIQLFHQMTQIDAGYLAATHEILIMNISMETRRSAPFTKEIQEQLLELSRWQAQQDVPIGAFRKLGIHHK